jgi:hypothetical protein
MSMPVHPRFYFLCQVEMPFGDRHAVRFLLAMTLTFFTIPIMNPISESPARVLVWSECHDGDQ